jgi:uncharacterized SAM-binding protein YcdF (DUF218 family)
LVGLNLFTDFYLVFLPPLERGTDIDKNYGDTILVLGGGLRKGPEIGFSTQERLLLAVDLFRQKKRTVIVSDGSLYPHSPAIKKITDFLVEKGVPKEYIRLEGKSQTTFDNFFNTHRILDEVNAREVIVCTSPYHQKRAEMILTYLEIGAFKIAKMKNSEILKADTIQRRLRNIWLISREYMGILKFKIFKK